MDKPEILTKKVARLSLCACGFPLFNNNISLGTEYQVPRYNFMGVSDKLICGGCGNETEVHLIMTIREGKPGWTPKEVFDWEDI